MGEPNFFIMLIFVTLFALSAVTFAQQNCLNIECPTGQFKANECEDFATFQAPIGSCCGKCVPKLTLPPHTTIGTTFTWGNCKCPKESCEAKGGVWRPNQPTATATPLTKTPFTYTLPTQPTGTFATFGSSGERQRKRCTVFCTEEQKSGECLVAPTLPPCGVCPKKACEEKGWQWVPETTTVKPTLTRSFPTFQPTNTDLPTFTNFPLPTTDKHTFGTGTFPTFGTVPPPQRKRCSLNCPERGQCVPPPSLPPCGVCPKQTCEAKGWVWLPELQTVTPITKPSFQTFPTNTDLPTFHTLPTNTDLPDKPTYSLPTFQTLPTFGTGSTPQHTFTIATAPKQRKRCSLQCGSGRCVPPPTPTDDPQCASLPVPDCHGKGAELARQCCAKRCRNNGGLLSEFDATKCREDGHFGCECTRLTFISTKETTTKPTEETTRPTRPQCERQECPRGTYLQLDLSNGLLNGCFPSKCVSVDVPPTLCLDTQRCAFTQAKCVQLGGKVVAPTSDTLFAKQCGCVSCQLETSFEVKVRGDADLEKLAEKVGNNLPFYTVSVERRADGTVIVTAKSEKTVLDDGETGEPKSEQQIKEVIESDDSVESASVAGSAVTAEDNSASIVSMSALLITFVALF